MEIGGIVTDRQVCQQVEQNIFTGSNPVRFNRSHRYEGLINYIASKYCNTAEIGIGYFPDVAFALLEKGVQVFATDIRPFQYIGLKVVVDDIMNPDISIYTSVDLIYSLRPPPELVPYMVRLARIHPTDLIVKPLTSEYLDGRLICHGNTTFFLWNFL
ncbi:MAG: UPF0146 family protein [Nitrospirota bacterium]